MVEDVITESESRMAKVVESLRKDLAAIRTGRASPALVERITVDYYGTPTHIYQLATISVPEARLIVIQPYEKNMVGPVEKAILKSELGLTPINDGRVIRLGIPQLTEERRKDLVKVVRRRVEEAKVAARNIRRESHEDLKELDKEKIISQDEERRAQERLQKVTDHFMDEIDRVGQTKEAEVLEV
ncbi:MAG: ribosome recycling factor [Dehalococcoidia bacterium]|nr:ribosome recycling factor [Dehalococcoidia bacterium]